MSTHLGLTIRPMQLEDLVQVQAIDRQSFSLPWPEHAYRYELEHNPQSLLWAAEVSLPDGQRQVVGMIVIWLILDEAHVATLAVRPDYRHQGIGQQLLNYALRESRRRGARRALLEVRAGNRAALTLYRQLGFEEVGRRPRYYKDNFEDAVLMTADLILEVNCESR